MRTFFWLLVLTAFATVLLAGSLTAETMSYPETNPVFSVEVPQGWRAQYEHGAAKISAPADAVFVLQYVQNIKDEKTAAAALPDLATLQGKQFSLQDIKVSAPMAATLMGAFKGFVMECSGKDPHGIQTSWQLMIFSPKENDYYLATCLWADSDAEKIAADREALFKSLKAMAAR